MLLAAIIKSALKSLYANKLRSILAMLGVIIGVGAVISMLAIGAGAQRDVMQRISSMGANLLVIRPGQEGVHGVRGGESQTLTEDDARAILERVPTIEQVSPVVGGSAQLKNENKNANSNILGTSVTYPGIRNYEVEFGRFFKEAETNRMARVAVLGPATAETLGITKDMLDATIKIKGINFKVVGILKSKGDQGWFNPDDQAIVPYTTAMNILFGKDKLREIDVEAKKGADLLAVQGQVEALLRRRHRIEPGRDDDFNVRNQAEIIETASEFNKTFSILLGGIASISLLVGGIGIMNIMLVTVTERTKEIGIRKAIGAKDRDILRQFLLEALIMTSLGGLIGVASGVGAARIISSTTDFATAVQPQAVIMAVAFSVFVGVFFGYYPAVRAARLDPIECLHYE